MNNIEEGAVVDPVCGMTVDPAHAAATREHRGKRYLFCCNHCAHKFAANPDSYLSPMKSTGLVQLGQKPPTSSAAILAQPTVKSVTNPPTAKYFCPMDPEVTSGKPGSCPKCGMALEPEFLSRTTTEYFCPMHPEVVSDHPGACPKCGMALEPRLTSAGAPEEDDHELRSMRLRFWIGV